jgi:simple sugar transport system substrate-binding protein
MNSKRSKPCIAVLYGILCIAATTAIGQPKPSEESPRRLKLIFITCCVDQTFFGPVKKGMQDAADMLDVDCEFVGTPGVDLKAQANLVRKAIADGYDGIAINLIDPTAFDEVVAEAVDRGIPVVAFNVDDSATPNARLASVCQHFFEAGRKLAERALADVPHNSHVLMTKHDDGVSALEDRLRGVQEVLAEHGVTWTTVVTGNESEKGAAAVASALRAHPDVRIIFSSGQSDTEAVGRAIESDFPNQGYWSAGFDLSPKTLQLVRDGHIRYTVDQQPYSQGFYPVTALVLKLRYGISPADIDAGAAIIDRSNVDQVLDLTSKGYR